MDESSTPAPVLSDFASTIFGEEPPNVFRAKPVASTSTSSKKKAALAKKDADKVGVATTRFNRLVTKSRATLIVCPLSTVQNWESQFAEHIAVPGGKAYRVRKVEDDDSEEEVKGKGKGRGKKATAAASASISIYVYHGVSRTTDPLELAKYDVVITTFSTLGAEFSKQARAAEERLNDVEAAKADSSDDEIVIYDSQGVALEPEAPAVTAPVKLKRKRVVGDGASPLQQVQWYRVVLDEAQ